MPKIRNFLWQLCHNALPARGTLLHRGLQVDPLCPVCLADIEDTDHIFMHCPMAHKVWDMTVTHQWLPNHPFNHPVSACCEELHLIAQNKCPWFSRVVLLLWSIWKSRNAVIFRNEIPSPLGILLHAKHNWAEWKQQTTSSSFPSSISYSSHQLNHHYTPSLHLIGWKLPQGGFIKLNFDVTKSAAGAVAGFVLRNW